jgi:hypothetical protein
MAKLTIERKGGLAGFGTSRSRIVSTGELELEDLSETDREVVEALLRPPKKATRSKSRKKPTEAADGFRYELSLEGELPVTVPEASVPQAVRQCVQDRFVEP